MRVFYLCVLVVFGILCPISVGKQEVVPIVLDDSFEKVDKVQIVVTASRIFCPTSHCAYYENTMTVQPVSHKQILAMVALPLDEVTQVLRLDKDAPEWGMVVVAISLRKKDSASQIFRSRMSYLVEGGIEKQVEFELRLRRPILAQN